MGITCLIPPGEMIGSRRLLLEWQEIGATVNKLHEALCSREHSRGFLSNNIKGVTVWIITGQSLLNNNFQVT